MRAVEPEHSAFSKLCLNFNVIFFAGCAVGAFGAYLGAGSPQVESHRCAGVVDLAQ